MHLDLSTRRALLLQGPVGPFFRRFGDELRRRGVEVIKVNFNAGDAFYYRGTGGREVIAYRGRMEDWPATFRRIVVERGIDSVFLFGDCRPIHAAAIAIAEELGVQVWVFEEGYLRPNFVTLERWGVNGNSRMPKDPAFYRQATANLPAPPEPVTIGNAFWHHAAWTIVHSVARTFGFPLYPRYRHHRSTNTFVQTYCWGRGAIRKIVYKVRERGIQERLVREHAGRYWFVPLQVYCDSQLSHSDYGSMEEFIEECVRTFAAAAPAGDLLVIKHHPHDIPYKDYRRYLRDLGARYACADRIIYVHDLHLPTVLKHARGCITMNSTVGTSALFHRCPVKVMGRAIYDVPGMTFQGSLAEFFVAPGRVDHHLFDRFCRYLRETNQINGNFYRRAAALKTIAGIDERAFAALPEVGAAPEALPGPRVA